MKEYSKDGRHGSARAFAENKKDSMIDSSDGRPRSGGSRDFFGVDRARESGERRSEKQLLRSQRLEALGTLVGGIAHDFNNILNVIAGHVTLMEKWRTDPERFMKSFEAVRKATDRGAYTAKQLLTFARKVDVSRVNIGDLVLEVVELLKETFPENIVFDVKNATGVPPVPADPNQIHQALLNLCMNARDAMPDGGEISIHIGTTSSGEIGKHVRTAKAGSYVVVNVSDTGCGIDKETMQRVFEPFFTTKDGYGTGLGLAVVYGIMKAHNGFIDVKSTVGKGTSFTLHFPVPRKKPEPRAEMKPAAGLPVGKGEMILVVESEKALKEFLSTVLTESGYKVLPASSGLEGLQTYREQMKKIDLVILDMGLSEMAGTEVLAGILMLNPSAKIISASGYLETESRNDALATGALDYMTKPYQVEEVLNKVRRAIGDGSDSAV